MRARAIVAATLMAVLLVGGATQAFAKDGDVVRQGACSGPSDWKLKLSNENGRIEVEFEVDQNVNGVAWDVELSRNGKVVVTATRTTHAPSGSFSIERRLTNGAGPDTISAEATSPSGEVCTATATI